MKALVPDVKLHIPSTIPGAACCGCCEGVTTETPAGIFNRASLSAIAYRVGQYGSFRASLHAALSSSAFSPLPDLLTRDADDFTIGLIDAFACAADVLSFYQERVANESWLRTATERLSLQEMGKLVGYRLRPGVAAETWLAFALDIPPSPPEGLAPEPGNFITGVPDHLTLQAGLKVQSIPGPGETPQTFELVETLADARPQWNAMQPWLSEEHVPQRDDLETWLEGVASNLKPGDAVVFAGDEYFSDATSDNWDFRLLTQVEPDNANKRTRIAWARGLGSYSPSSAPAVRPHAFALRKRSGVFGNNAPVWRSMNLSFRLDYVALFDRPNGNANADQWPRYEISENGVTATGGFVDLDQVQSEIVADVPGDIGKRSLVVLAKGSFNRANEALSPGTYVELYSVVATSEVSRAEFALSGKVTRLELNGENLGIFFNNVRETSVYGKSDYLPLAERPVATAVSGGMIPVLTDTAGLEPGRRLLISGISEKDGAAFVAQATLVAAHAKGVGRAELEIKPMLPLSLIRKSVVVNANVALASHGETATEVLGDGRASEKNQRFELKQLPLSYRAAATELGAAAELTIRVGDIAWTERDTLYGAEPGDRAYALSVDEKNRLFVNFGDGVAGARLPSGSNNIRATYRKGLGAAGNVQRETLNQLMTRPLGLKGVSNPLKAEGGTDPETAAAARETIPLTTRTLGRAVSALDYEDYARAFSGVAKAQSMVLDLRGGRSVAITLAGPGGDSIGPASPVWEHLLAALKSGGDPFVPVMLLTHSASTFRLGIRVKRDPGYDATKVLAAVEAALRQHFAFDARNLGQPVQQSDVIATAQAVAGVVAVDLSHLYGGTQGVQQAQSSVQTRILAARMRVENGEPRPAEILTLHPGPFEKLEEMA